MRTFFLRVKLLVLTTQEVNVRTGLCATGAAEPLPLQALICLAGGHGGQDQQDDAVDQNDTDWKQESPEHGLAVVKALFLVQSCEPAAARVTRLELAPATGAVK